MAKKSEFTSVKSSYTVYADFTLGRKEYKAGDTFSPSEDYELDGGANEFRNVERKGKKPRGLVFKFYAGLDGNKEAIYKSVILPVE